MVCCGMAACSTCAGVGNDFANPNYLASNRSGACEACRQPASETRLGDNLIDLMTDFSLSSARGIGGAWKVPPYMGPAHAFDERYGQWCNNVVPGLNRLPWYNYASTSSPCELMR